MKTAYGTRPSLQEYTGLLVIWSAVHSVYSVHVYMYMYIASVNFTRNVRYGLHNTYTYIYTYMLYAYKYFFSHLVEYYIVMFIYGVSN